LFLETKNLLVLGGGCARDKGLDTKVTNGGGGPGGGTGGLGILTPEIKTFFY